MEQTTINGYKVTIFTGYNGTQLFITDADGVQVYAHKVSGDPVGRAREVIASFKRTETIELTRGKVALIDYEDFERVSKFKWQALITKVQNKWYARRLAYLGSNQKGVYLRRNISLHRFILNAPPHLWVDHIDNDGLNNQKNNLRLCTPSQNAKNKRTNSASGFKGVYLSSNGFYAQIYADGKKISLGSYKTAIEAAQAYDKAAIKLHGEFAFTNFGLETIR